MQKTYTIGEVAKMTGASIKTIRYYDEIGLLSPASTSPGGYRLYSPDEIWRLEFIRTLRYLGFGIGDIRKILQGEVDSGKAIDWQVEALDRQIHHLTRIRDILRRAKESNHIEGKLDYIEDIIEVFEMDFEERKNFITNKLGEAVVGENASENWAANWKEQVAKNLTSMLPKELSPEQAEAWAKLQELLNDPTYIAEMQQTTGGFWQTAGNSDMEPSNWSSEMLNINNRIVEAYKQGKTVESDTVQAIVMDWVGLFAKLTHQELNDDFLRGFVETSKKMTPESSERFHELWAIINPAYGIQTNAHKLLIEGLKWKVSQLL